MKKVISLPLLLILIASITFAQEYIPKQKELLEFGKLKIVETSQKSIGFEIEVIGLENFRGKFSRLNKQSLITEIKEIQLQKGQKFFENLTMEDVKDNDIKMISINIEIVDAPIGYKKSYYKYYYVKKIKGEYEITDQNFIDQNSIKKIGEDIKIKQGKSSLLLINTQNYNVNISGEINIDGIQKGLYGNGVVLWFRNTNNPSQWYHPVLGNEQNVHYDILDEQGNFNFNFNFSGNLSNYNQAIILVNTANAAAYMPTPSNGYTVWSDNGYTSYFNEAEGVVIPINGSNSNINVAQNGTINQSSGEILRYMMLARELSIQRYNGNCPYNVSPILAKKEVVIVNGQEVAGVFVVEYSNGYVHYIKINPSSTDFATVSHEYGHYINFLMWGRERFSAATSEIKEGWAIFYSFASRNYGNKVYGDYFDNYDENTEIAPFYL
jgi:hypothetical protein